MNALARLGRKRRDRRAQTEEPVPFAVESCECLVDGSFALLRLTGTGINPPASLVADNDRPQSFQPLPQPDEGVHGGVWRAAFAIPAEIAEPGTLLWLLDGGEYMTDVRVPPPADAPRAAKAAPERTVEPAPPARAERIAEPVADDPDDDPRSRKLVDAWSEAAALRESLSDREQELSRSLQELLEARAEVDPLRERAGRLADELSAVRGELELAQVQGREARLRASQAAAEMDALRAANVAELEALQANGAAELSAVRAELAAELETIRAELDGAEPRLTEALERAERAEQEAAALRDQVERLEKELADARAQIEAGAQQAQADREQLASAAADQQRTAEELQSELEKLKEQPKSRRRGLGRRTDDREANEIRTGLEARIAEQQERIEQLEQEAASFAERREEAVSESLLQRVGELEDELRQHVATGDDLRALLASERELVASARTEVRDLKKQLGEASAKRAASMAAASAGAPSDATAKPAGPAAKNGDAPAQAAGEPPPWSALDDELLARIERAKALTG